MDRAAAMASRTRRRWTARTLSDGGTWYRQMEFQHVAAGTISIAGSGRPSLRERREVGATPQSAAGYSPGVWTPPWSTGSLS